MHEKSRAVQDVIIKSFGIIFTILLFTVSVFTLVIFAPKFMTFLMSAEKLLSGSTPSQIERIFNDSIYRQNDWITLYGGSQRIFLKREINNFEIVKDDNGFLILPTEHYDLDTLSAKADNLQFFAELCQEREIPFLFVMAPGNVIPGKTSLPTGVDDFANENIDLFLGMLCEREIPFLDVRTLTERMPLEDIVYKTDHHWALPIAFKTFSEIIAILNSTYALKLDEDFLYRDLENYVCRFYPKSFLGSSGIKVGEWYTGMDLFRVYDPIFETRLTNQYYVASELQWLREGPFWDAIIQEELLNDDGYYNKYNAYMYGSSCESRITNELAQNDSRLLLISDSFGRQMVPYMSLCFAETAWLDPQAGRYTESYTSYIDEFQPDCVVILFNGRSCYIDIPV